MFSVTAAAVFGVIVPMQAAPARISISLNGKWQVTDSVSATEMPSEFDHTAPVPGLANLAKPGFKGVDLFDSQELVANRIRKGNLPESARVHTPGISRQDRNYFWYRKTFRAPSRKPVALLTINKAQFGTAVWVNEPLHHERRR
jgi:beta-galactosidase